MNPITFQPSWAFGRVLYGIFAMLMFVPHFYPVFGAERNAPQIWQFDPAQAFHLEFGRGSGMDGLDTVVADQSGRAVLHRRNEDSRKWETAELTLAPKSIQRIAKAVVDLDLIAMNCTYHANVNDGTQWVFWLQQGGKAKSIYFDNRFLASIKKFAAILDEELDRAGKGKATWKEVPKSMAREYEKALWKSIENRTPKP
jgi:hypothetical protein